VVGHANGAPVSPSAHNDVEATMLAFLPILWPLIMWDFVLLQCSTNLPVSIADDEAAGDLLGFPGRW
jgi:hypothetical protein